MRIGFILGIIGAVLVHAFLLAFGGILWMRHDDGSTVRRDVELVSEMDEEKKEEKKEEEKPEEEEEKIEETAEEAPPDAEEIIRSMEQAPVDATPRLEDASLSAIEAALSGSSGGSGDFAETLTFAGGGRIGGTGKVGADESESVEDSAFSMSEIDQKPRAVYQSAAQYPAELRGKKVEGVVNLLFVVDEQGRVSNPKVEKTTHQAFVKPALDAIRQWRFEPAVRGGARVSCKMRVPMRFKPV